MKMITLTMIPNPDINDGETTTCMVAPECVIMLLRAKSAFGKWDFPDKEIHKDQIFPKTLTHHDPYECTMVYLSVGHTLCVQESVEKVRELMDATEQLNKIGFQ